MKLVTFSYQGKTAIGALLGEEVVDLTASNPRLPNDMIAFLELAEVGMLVAKKEIAESNSRIPLEKIKLQAPIANPRKFLGLGFNYRSHVEELKNNDPTFSIPDNQFWFTKQVTCVTGPFDPIYIPQVSDKLDYEGEMAIVIGKRCRHVAACDAQEVIAGYMVCNDVSVRDWQMKAPTLGKSFDTHGPIGPYLTTADEVAEPENLRLRTWVDDELRQDGSTNDFVYSIGEMIEELTSVFTLEPGDILATGTPSGVGSTFKPPKFLKVGQLVSIEVEGLGRIENRVSSEPNALKR